VRRFDLQTHSLSAADLSSVTSGSVILRSGSVGQTESAYVQTRKENGTGSLIAFEFGNTDTPQNPRALANWPARLKEPTEIFWTAENKPLTLHDNVVYEWPTPDEPRKFITFSGSGEGPPELRTGRQEFTHSNGTLMVMVLNAKGRTWAEIFDMNTKQLVGRLQLPDDTHEARLTADGERLILSRAERVTVFNYQLRLHEAKQAAANP